MVVKKNDYPSKFIGRRHELGLLTREYEKKGASLIVLYGRRRVGKTRMVTEFYKDKSLWHFDGLEVGGKAVQIRNFMNQLSTHTDNDIYKSVGCSSWLDALKLLDKVVSESKEGYKRTIFFDEFQYMAARQEELVAALKWAWDNLWQDKEGFTMVLCGSVASFMLKKVVESSSLYGRIKLEICLKPISIPETYDFFGGKKSIREICDLYMFCGGIPEYLLQINPKESIFQNISRLAFAKDGYFLREFDRIFKDTFSEEKIYRKIITALSKYKSLKIPELTGMLKVSGGGGFVDYMQNLESAGFVRSVVPWNRPQDSKLRRYQLDDEYIFFYFKFIYPNLKKIENNQDINWGISLLKGPVYKSWAGFAFERIGIKHVPQLTKILNIDQLVKNYGPYFSRASNSKDAFQIDLLFIRHDPVITVCEFKYYDGLIGKWIIKEMENKVSLLSNENKTIEKVLITTNGITDDLKETNYFSSVVLLNELFGVGVS